MTASGLAASLTWRFASFVFFAAVTAGPLCRLIPLDACKRLAPRRQLIWSFCASYARVPGVAAAAQHPGRRHP